MTSRRTFSSTLLAPLYPAQHPDMDRTNSYKNDYDTQSIRSFRSSTSGSVSEAGRTEAMSLARPRTDQEIEDRFVDFMVSASPSRTSFSCIIETGVKESEICEDHFICS